MNKSLKPSQTHQRAPRHLTAEIRGSDMYIDYDRKITKRMKKKINDMNAATQSHYRRNKDDIERFKNLGGQFISISGRTYVNPDNF